MIESLISAGIGLAGAICGGLGSYIAARHQVKKEILTSAYADVMHYHVMWMQPCAESEDVKFPLLSSLERARLVASKDVTVHLIALEELVLNNRPKNEVVDAMLNFSECARNELHYRGRKHT